MEKLRIKIGKKKTVSAMVDEFTIGGTSDHNLLKNREMNNQHPINAITGLEDALNNRVTNEKLIAEVDSALKSAKESGLFDGKDGEDGHTPQKGIDYFDGEPGNDGIGILSIEQESASSTSGGENIIKITLTDGRVQRFIIKNGSGGKVEISQMDVINALGYTPINRDSIVDDLETRVVNLPLSAAQGAKLKDLIDDITVPTKTSQLTNDSKFMSSDEVVSKINEAISGLAGGLKFEIVDTIEDLPTWCDDSNTIYLVPSEKTEGNQYYNEYLWMNGRWEKFGDTQVNLEPYYTGMKVDNLIYNVQKSIPTKMSQLYNDAGYVKAKDIETGEATWESIKDNIVETLETPITWDGDTTGRETHPTYTAFYKVSDVVLTAEEAVGLRYDTTYNDNSYVIPEVGTNWLINTVDYGTYWLVMDGIICVYDESIGCSKGIYFLKSVADDGTNKEYWTNELILEADKIKPELLPDIMETIGSDTLTWDGNTEGKYTLDLSFMMGSETPVGSVVATKVSDATPTLEELNAGATIVMNLVEELPNDALIAGGTIPNFIQYQNFENVYVSEKVVNGNSTSYNFVVAVVTSATDGGNGIVFEEGIYLVKMNLSLFLEGANAFLFPTSVTFNGYTFKREVIKEEYLPPSIPREGMTVKSKSFADGTEMHNWLKANNEKALKYVFYMNGSYESCEPPVDVKQGGEVWFKFSKQRLHDVSSIGETMAFTGFIGETHETYSAFHTGIDWKITGNGTEVVSYGERLEIPNEYLTPANGISCTVYYVD